jgi:drug/metabolite transporter (DMT)-like permease
MIIIKRFPITASPLVAITWQLLIAGACMTLGVVTFEGSWPPDRVVSGATIAAIVYNVFSQALSQILWFEALSRLPAAFAALGVLLVPTVAMLGSMLILHEQPTLLDSVGLLLVTCASANVQIASFTHWWRQRRLRANGI